MNELQKRFFEHLANIQESCVEICMIQHKCDDKTTKSMLYDVTYEAITQIMVMIDGYSTFSENKHDIVNTVTGEHLKENPSIELHDQTEEFLKYE
ncbi:hypothetical protein GCM10008910_06340 [Faecalicatena orotica]|uniref:Uncharacterized protein n=1 Tax=Faecalicatena orotica TaxID=1544 RepID=A0A2Y9C9S2_9FIRM|nr:hypothetical protein [Faecalicatena orotica]PWJ30697.1 hypothetical protein A8806_103101 [Faecalicatena orotica]SSA54858.1 hypothetical protein SAMN05216536_103101 [Faecalicatena orotica]